MNITNLTTVPTSEKFGNMCSIGEDDFGDGGGVHSMFKESPPTHLKLDGICKKCGQRGDIIQLSFREPECHQCFLIYARHKFRATLGSSKVLPKGANVLLLFDGSPEAVVLLDMMHYAQSQNNFKRLHCTTRVLFVDTFILDEGETQHKIKLQNIACWLKKYHCFEYYITPFSANLGKLTNLEDIDDYLDHVDFMHNQQELKLGLNAMSSLTTRQDYVKNQRHRLIAAACGQLNCNFVFLPDISTNLATQLLTDIVLGRGGSVALDVSLVDDRFSGLKLLRPLKDLNAVEVRYYMQVQSLKPIILNSYGEKLGETASLQNLTKAFVDHLQQSYASTVSTIFRTGDKLAPNDLLSQEIQNLNICREDKVTPSICTFCHSKLDYSESRTILATEFSRIVSESGASIENCSNIETLAKKSILNNTGHEQSNLCHSCRNILKETSNKNLVL